MIYKKSKLINRMKQLGMKYKDLAQATGYCYGHLVHSLNGDYMMSTRMRNKIIKVFQEVEESRKKKVTVTKKTTEVTDKEKKYLNTIQDVLDLKDTDTIIHCENCTTKFKFINGVLCGQKSDGNTAVCVTLPLGPTVSKKYILVDKKVQEATKEDVGKLCKFWDEDPNTNNFGILGSLTTHSHFNYIKIGGCCYKHCRRATLEEVKELTGYEVKGE